MYVIGHIAPSFSLLQSLFVCRVIFAPKGEPIMTDNYNKKQSLKIEDLMIERYNSGHMCKGCLLVSISPLNYKCPIHHKEVI